MNDNRHIRCNRVYTINKQTRNFLTPGHGPAIEPKVIHLAVGFSISYEAGAHLLQHKTTVGALETGRVPLEVRRHTQDELVEDRAAAPGTHARPSNS